MASHQVGPVRSWYAVRCVFHVSGDDDSDQRTFEERITIWAAESAGAAIARAEREAQEYAAAVIGTAAAYLGLAQSYKLPSEPIDGAEVFSLLRDTDLTASAYVSAFFDTGSERQEVVDPD